MHQDITHLHLDKYQLIQLLLLLIINLIGMYPIQILTIIDCYNGSIIEKIILFKR